jgi:hypothetical protein
MFELKKVEGGYKDIKYIMYPKIKVSYWLNMII